MVPNGQIPPTNSRIIEFVILRSHEYLTTLSIQFGLDLMGGQVVNSSTPFGRRRRETLEQPHHQFLFVHIQTPIPNNRNLWGLWIYCHLFIHNIIKLKWNYASFDLTCCHRKIMINPYCYKILSEDVLQNSK